ncbi:MAG: CbiX/SirB N-terminal domain-containing protein [Pseudomonadota bacterium]
MKDLTTGILLFAHGSRDPQWRGPVEAVASNILQREPGKLVQCAYLELCDPTLPDAAAALIAKGAQKLKVFPLFLGVGKHAREDLPKLIEQIREAHPHMKVELLPAIGELPQLTALIADIALE